MSKHIQRTTAFVLTAIAKCFSSSGQSYMGVNSAIMYVAEGKHSAVRHGMVAGSMVAGFAVNLGLKLPVIYASFFPNENAINLPARPISFQHYYAKIFYYTLFSLGFVSTEISDPLNAYLGGITISNMILNDSVYAIMLKQAFSLGLAFGIIFANYAYDFKFVSENARNLAENLDNHHFVFDKAMLVTMLFSLPVLLGAPILAYYFGVPAIADIPGAEYLLKNVGMHGIAGALAIAAFGRTICSLPSIYSSFAPAAHSVREDLQIYPVSCKSSSVKFCAAAGGIDSLASGLCLLVGVITVAQELFNLSPQAIYDWPLVTIAIIFAISQVIQNALFNVKPGYDATMKYIHAEVDRDPEAQIGLLGVNSEIELDRFAPQAHHGSNTSLLFSQSNHDVSKCVPELEHKNTV